MVKKRNGLASMIIGVGITATSLLADVLDLGGDPSVIGWKQLLGAGGGVGLILFLGAMFLLYLVINAMAH